MAYANVADRDAIENEMPWDARDLPTTTYALLSDTAQKHGNRKAVSFSLLSNPNAKCETLNWNALKAKTTQAANLFRSLGVGEDDVVAYLLPNATETILTYLDGQVAGIVKRYS